MNQGRTWLLVALALVGGLIGGALSSRLGADSAFAVVKSKHAKIIRTERLILVGHEGEDRGVLQVTRRGMADLALLDEKGKDRTELRVAADGSAALGFYDSEGRKRLVVGESAQSQAGLGIFSPEGRQVASLATQEKGGISLTLYDRNSGFARVGLALAPDGAPALAMFDKNGKDRAEFHVTADGKPALALADEKGKTVAGLPAH